VVHGGRLLGRRHAELAVKDADAVAVLSEGRSALSAGAVERDQPAMRGLVERIEREPPPRVLDRPHSVGAVGEAIEDRAELARQRRGAKRLPVVENGAIPQPEAGEEDTAVKRGRAFEIRKLLARSEPLELADVDLAALERNGIPRNLDPPAAERRAQRRERAAERCTRAIGRVVRPQQFCERVAIVDASLDREIREQRGRLARIHRQGRAVGKHDRRTEHADGERHGASLLGLSVTP
jgi:hypothetical protein